jgi:hypothetical protein
MAEIMMATTLAEDVPRFARPSIEFLGSEDFETASIRSAAPSYSKLAPNPPTLPSHQPNH